jgi:hypothetical protein
MPTAIESWPAPLADLSFQTVSLTITKDERHALCVMLLEQQGDEYAGDIDIIKEHIEIISDRISNAINCFGSEGAFVKLSLRSPKDSWIGMAKTGFRVTSGKEAMALILDSTERMVEDLLACEEADVPLQIHVRRWATIQPYAEFRCFMRDRRLVGISQYSYQEEAISPEIVVNAKSIEASIKNFFGYFVHRSHLDSVVFDVAFVGESPYWPIVPELIELNPFTVEAFGTDPCLFRDNNFDGSFRYLGDGTHNPEKREIVSLTDMFEKIT